MNINGSGIQFVPLTNTSPQPVVKEQQSHFNTSYMNPISGFLDAKGMEKAGMAGMFGTAGHMMGGGALAPLLLGGLLGHYFKK